MNENATYYHRPTAKTTSRLAKRKQENLNRQTWIMFGLSAIILVVFLFVILPNLLGSLFNDGESTSIVDKDEIPPQTPIFSAPPSATFSGQISLSGFTEPSSSVFLVLNGEKLEEVKADETGTFNQEINLISGENQVQAYAVDSTGNESELSRSYQIILDAEAPTLELESPQDGQTIELRKNQLTTIKGTTEPQAKVKINGRLVVANSSGEFSSTYQLEEGDNELLFEIEDLAGNTFSQTIKVIFKL